MGILTLNDLVASTKQRFSFHKNTPQTLVSARWYSLNLWNGYPGIGANVSNTTTGVVPTDATVGYPKIIFSSGTGYLQYAHTATAANAVYNSVLLYDRLFEVGSIAYTSGTTTLSTQPSYSSRIINSSYDGLILFFTVTTAFVTGNNWSIVVTYTDQDGNTGTSSSSLAFTVASNLSIGSTYIIPFAAGDSGIQKIESIIVTNAATAMTAGAFEVFIARPLALITNTPYMVSYCGTAELGLPIVFQDSAINQLIFPDATTQDRIHTDITIASKA